MPLNYKNNENNINKNNIIDNIDNINIDNINIELINPQKVFWPEENITKKDLFEYYLKISKYILPYITNRLQSLNRCPDGIYGQCFYQKDVDYKLPNGLFTMKVFSESSNEDVDYFVCNGFNSLLYIVNLGCIDIHPWNSRISNLHYPDFAVLDLDPVDVEFDVVIEVARTVKLVLDSSRITGFCKTSGSRGMHIYIPLGAEYTFEQALEFIKLIAKAVNLLIPQITSLERHPQKRQKKVYLDCYQNKFGATVAAPYCVRPKKGAPVSTPLKWEELFSKFVPQDFNIKNIFSRLDKIGDIWKGVLGDPVDIIRCTDEILRKFNF